MNFMIQQALMTEFRPVFIVMLAILIVFFFLSLIRDGQRRGITFSMILTVSIIHILIAVVAFFVESNIIEAYDLTADRITLYLLIAIIVLGVANPIIYKLRNKANSRYRYHRRY